MPLEISEIAIRLEVGSDDPTAPTLSEAELNALKTEVLAECKRVVDSHVQRISDRTGIPVKANIGMR